MNKYAQLAVAGVYVAVAVALIYVVKQIAEKGGEARDTVAGAISAPIESYILRQSNLVQASGNLILPSGQVMPTQYLSSPQANRVFDASTNTVLFTYSSMRYRLTGSFDEEGNRVAVKA